MTGIAHEVVILYGVDADGEPVPLKLNSDGTLSGVGGGGGVSPYTTTPQGVSVSAGSAGSVSLYSRGDHVHKLTEANISLNNLGEKAYTSLTGKPTIPVNGDFTLTGLSEKAYASLTGKPTIPVNSDFTLNGLSEKAYSSLTGTPTIPTDLSSKHYITTQAEADLSAEQVLGTAIIISGLDSAKPAAGTAGRLYFSTDINGGTLYRDNGAAWVQISQGLTENVPALGSTPSTQAFDDAATGGSATTASKNDHKHTMPTNPITGHVAAGDPHAQYALESALSTVATTGVYSDLTGKPTIPTDLSNLNFIVGVNSSALSGESQLATVVGRIGTLVDLPTSPGQMAGRLFFVTDEKGGQWYYDSGASWVPNSPGIASLRATGVDKVLYVDHSGVVTELALGAASTYLKSNGATSAPTFAALTDLTAEQQLFSQVFS